jgi:uncharacterized membrane protein YedE/YeeE
MKRNALLILSGMFFSVGLFVSGMTNPQKVVSFLDITGEWDPSLMFVMLGAIVPTFILYRFAWKLKKPIFASDFDLPVKKTLDRKLIVGSILFGIGWGIAGVCPGPGVANVLAGNFEFLVFVIFMLIGLLLGDKK